MLSFLLLKGSLIGLSVSMPMGPTGMLCLRHAALKGRAFGIASGIGIALAEASCGAITALGLSALTAFIESNQAWLQMLGSLFLFYFGLFSLKQGRKEHKREVAQNGYLQILAMMFILTLTNPLTLLSFVAIFSTLGVEYVQNDSMALLFLSSGVFFGSATWWAMISSGSSYFAKKVESSLARTLHKTASFAIIGISVFSFFSALHLFFFS